MPGCTLGSFNWPKSGNTADEEPQAQPRHFNTAGSVARVYSDGGLVSADVYVR